ncbi:MAG: tryptophan--tRNA ligase [Candidatus Pacebacteria bacterium]|nr:tryptophan--tRNA ligase [Candidatus Paceibacterota bacterium]
MPEQRKKRILTGDRPTGCLHLGHYVGSLKNRVDFQDDYDCFFIIADYQVLTDHINNTKGVGESIRNILLDYLSVGIDPKKSSIFIQSMIPEIAQLTMYFSMLVSVPRLQRNPTIKEEATAARIGAKEISYGFLGYPVSQAADILSVRADVVPVGEDQLPHLEQTREIAKSFNRTFDDVFKYPEALLGEYPRLPGIDRQKMSKSRGNAIFLSDSPEEVAKKVMKAYTDPQKIHLTDPGHIEGNVVFNYLDAFYDNKKEIDDLKGKYERGEIGDVAIKKILIDILNEFLSPIRERRRQYEDDPKLLEKILLEGNERTREEAQKTLELVHKAMNYHYGNIFSFR